MSATGGHQPVVPVLPQVLLRLTLVRTFSDLVTEDTTLVQLLIVLGTLEVIGYK